MLIGLLQLVIFSRLFGTGSLWEPVMGDSYQPGVKSIVQEGVELMSYALVLYGSALSCKSVFKSRPT
jgi:hypothetical protein